MPLTFLKSTDVSHVICNGVLRVTVERPAKRNPLSLGVLQQINEIFTGYQDDQTLRMAIVTGAGDLAFASGGDLVELAILVSAESARALSIHGKAALNAIRRFPVPVVARVNGVALGGGAELALACDMRFAASHASIGFIHSRLAISPSWGGGVDLMRLVGYATGTRLLARAEILGAKQALALGLFDEIAPEGGSFNESFDEYVSGMARQPPHLMRAVKAIAASERLADLDQRHETETDQFTRTWVHNDHWSAVTAVMGAKLKKKTSIGETDG